MFNLPTGSYCLDTNVLAHGWHGLDGWTRIFYSASQNKSVKILSYQCLYSEFMIAFGFKSTLNPFNPCHPCSKSIFQKMCPNSSCRQAGIQRSTINAQWKQHPVFFRRKKSVFIRPTRVIRVPVFCRPSYVIKQNENVQYSTLNLFRYI